MKSYQIYQTKVEKFGFINYVYFIIDKRTRKAAIVDPSWDYEKISQTARNMGIEVVAVLLTHLHIDHSFSAKKYVDNNPDCKIYLSKNEYEYYKYSGKGIVTLSHFEQIIIGDTAIRCLVTPGHTKGSAFLLVFQVTVNIQRLHRMKQSLIHIWLPVPIPVLHQEEFAMSLDLTDRQCRLIQPVLPPW